MTYIVVHLNEEIGKTLIKNINPPPCKPLLFYRDFCSSINGVLKFTKSLDTLNYAATENEKDTIDVKVITLDSIWTDDVPALIKIIVEGFETEVLLGAKQTLENDTLKAIIIELNDSGDRYGYDDNLIHEIG